MEKENQVITISINVRLNDEGRSVRELYFNGLLLRSETSVNGYINPDDPVSRLIRFVIDGYGKNPDNQ